MKRPSPEGVVLVAGALLRLYLALVNTEANDDHLTVIRIIAQQHRFPRLREAWEAFQPKLYHSTVAVLWNLSPWSSPAVQVRIAQLVACAAGIATLLVVRRALIRYGVPPSIRLLAFALVALNPTLIGLDAQATNDAFVILFTTVALVQGAEFFRTGARPAFLIMTGAVLLAVLSKGNGLVVFVAVAATLLLAILRPPAVPELSRRRLVRRGAVFIAAVVLGAALLGPYRANWEDTGDPFAINGDRAPLPHLFARTSVYRPGVTSIADAYFTFRLVDLLEHPTITNDPVTYPLHRTSLWSQLYGRAYFAHFAQHPPSWRSTHPVVLAVGRLILLLALLPTALLLVGMARAIVALMAPSRWRVAAPAPRLEEDLRTLTAVGFVAFIVVYTLTYRDFSTMKAEFLFPALLPFSLFFADRARRAEGPWLRWAIGPLLLLYLADIGILAAQLT